MSEQEFIRQLQEALSRIPERERLEIVDDYREYFRDGLAAGRSESDIATGLGDPSQLARELMARHHIERWESRKSFGNLFALVGAIAGLGFLNFLLAIPFLFYLWLLTMAALASSGILIGGLVVCGALLSHALFGWPVLHEGHHGRVVWSALSQSGASSNIHILGENGEKVEVLRDASSGRASIHILSRDGSVSLERGASDAVGRLQIEDPQSRVDIDGLGWFASYRGMLVTGIVLMLLGGGGLLLCYFLVRLTWRGLLSYGRYQLAVLGRARGMDG